LPVEFNLVGLGLTPATNSDYMLGREVATFPKT